MSLSRSAIIFGVAAVTGASIGNVIFIIGSKEKQALRDLQLTQDLLDRTRKYQTEFHNVTNGTQTQAQNSVQVYYDFLVQGYQAAMTEQEKWLAKSFFGKIANFLSYPHLDVMEIERAASTKAFSHQHKT